MWPMQMMSATVNADLMRFYGEYAYGSISNIPRTTLLYNNWLTMEKNIAMKCLQIFYAFNEWIIVV